MPIATAIAARTMTKWVRRISTVRILLCSGLSDLSCCDVRLTLVESVTRRDHMNLAVLLRLGTNYEQGQSVESGAMVGMKWLNRGGIAVVHRSNVTCSAHAEVHKVVRHWAQIPVLVLDPHRHE